MRGLRIIATLIIAFFLAIIVAIIVAGAAHAADFQPVFKNTILPHEGGWVNNPIDRGKETYRGISRANFPKWLGWAQVDKVKATLGPQPKYGTKAYWKYAKALNKALFSQPEVCGLVSKFYESNFWLNLHLDKMKSQGISDELCDEAVNMGEGGADALLAKVFREIEWATKKPIPVPPRFTLKTVEWINEYTKDRDNRIAFYNSVRIKRVRFYVNLAKKHPEYESIILAWADRATD